MRQTSGSGWEQAEGSSEPWVGGGQGGLMGVATRRRIVEVVLGGQ